MSLGRLTILRSSLPLRLDMDMDMDMGIDIRPIHNRLRVQALGPRKGFWHRRPEDMKSCLLNEKNWRV